MKDACGYPFLGGGGWHFASNRCLSTRHPGYNNWFDPIGFAPPRPPRHWFYIDLNVNCCQYCCCFILFLLILSCDVLKCFRNQIDVAGRRLEIFQEHICPYVVHGFLLWRKTVLEYYGMVLFVRFACLCFHGLAQAFLLWRKTFVCQLSLRAIRCRSWFHRSVSLAPLVPN